MTADYTLNNPDTLTKYKTAAQISHKVLESVIGTCGQHLTRLDLNKLKGGALRAKRLYRYVSVETSYWARR